jgi:uncharacterized protein YoxC
MIAGEFLVLAAALVAATIYIVRLQAELGDCNEAMDEAEEALEAADKAVEVYQRVLMDVAHKQATLEVTDDGYIIATHGAFGKVQIH